MDTCRTQISGLRRTTPAMRSAARPLPPPRRSRSRCGRREGVDQSRAAHARTAHAAMGRSGFKGSSRLSQSYERWIGALRASCVPSQRGRWRGASRAACLSRASSLPQRALWYNLKPPPVDRSAPQLQLTSKAHLPPPPQPGLAKYVKYTKVQNIRNIQNKNI